MAGFFVSPRHYYGRKKERQLIVAPFLNKTYISFTLFQLLRLFRKPALQ